MNQFGVLYRYEWKKVLEKKIVWISFSLSLLIGVISFIAPLLGDYYIDGKFIGTNYDLKQADRAYARELNGRKIDQSLIEETIAAYRTIPKALETHYTGTEEYQKYARPYSEIFGFIRKMSGMQTAEAMYSWQPSEKDLYAKRRAWLTDICEGLRLSEGETAFWNRREEQIRTPYVYEEHDAYITMLSSYQTVGLFVLLLTAICLSGVFSDEHTRKTDQIVLSCPLGKTRLYWAKTAVGISFAAMSTLLLFASQAVLALSLYGTGGFRAAFQLIYAPSSDSITCGQAVLIAYGIMLITAVFMSVFVMVLSEVLQSNIATLAISTGLLILPMIAGIPDQYRVPAQIWDWLPWSFLAPWNIFDKYTVSLFGRYLPPWQAVPLLYLAAGAVIAFVGKPVYQRFQVSGR